MDLRRQAVTTSASHSGSPWSNPLSHTKIFFYVFVYSLQDNDGTVPQIRLPSTFSWADWSSHLLHCNLICTAFRSSALQSDLYSIPILCTAIWSVQHSDPLHCNLICTAFRSSVLQCDLYSIPILCTAIRSTVPQSGLPHRNRVHSTTIWSIVSQSNLPYRSLNYWQRLSINKSGRPEFLVNKYDNLNTRATELHSR
jgi:hypothetical protein